MELDVFALPMASVYSSGEEDEPAEGRKDVLALGLITKWIKGEKTEFGMCRCR